MSNDTKSFRSNMGRVKGLGAAHDGLHHWKGVRLSALALIPLGLWFVFSLIGLLGTDAAGLAAWLKNPAQALALLAFLGFGFYHSVNGIQEVVEDYIHGKAIKGAILLVNKTAHAVGAAMAVYAVILMAFKA